MRCRIVLDLFAIPANGTHVSVHRSGAKNNVLHPSTDCDENLVFGLVLFCASYSLTAEQHAHALTAIHIHVQMVGTINYIIHASPIYVAVRIELRFYSAHTHFHRLISGQSEF